MNELFEDLVRKNHISGSLEEESDMGRFLRELNRKRILRLPEVCRIVGLSRQTIHRYRAMNPPRFPQSVKIGISAVGWTAESISQWIAEREIESTTVHSIH